MRITWLAIFAAIGTQAAQAAESPAMVRSAVFVERTSQAERTIEPATTLGSGDRVVTILDWQAPQGGKDATVMLAIPRHLAFQRSSSGEEDVSIDGGRSWGKLGQMQVRDAYGLRLASPEDVTNVRWRVNGPNGRITYSALVR